MLTLLILKIYSFSFFRWNIKVDSAAISRFCFILSPFFTKWNVSSMFLLFFHYPNFLFLQKIAKKQKNNWDLFHNRVVFLREKLLIVMWRIRLFTISKRQLKYSITIFIKYRKMFIIRIIRCRFILLSHIKVFWAFFEKKNLQQIGYRKYIFKTLGEFIYLSTSSSGLSSKNNLELIRIIEV